ncbi:MAG TPA: dienelactone hydrolase family protein [Thermoanaerobaculia bacterium]|nr:dienelactone hydrolase family protein [Thermoanaerobaculia bacterium]
MNRKTLPSILLVLLLPACGHAGDEKSDLDRMAQEHKHDKPVASQAATTPPVQEVTGEEVVYAEVGGKPVRGFLAKPKAGAAQDPLPAVIVIQEWWGLNDNIRQMAKRLAGEGYTALAVDLYGGQVASDPGQAQKLMQAVLQNRAAGEENLRQAYNYLEMKQKAPKIGVIGWCFGGGWSLATALMLPDKIDATVIYYGHLETDKEKLGKLGMPVLAFFGGKDKSMPVATVRQFEATMKELGKPVEVHVYDEADHAFANPSGGNYNEPAAKDSWQRTTAFFAKHLKGKV